jgi:hypothetical protein
MFICTALNHRAFHEIEWKAASFVETNPSCGAQEKGNNKAFSQDGPQ